jgi:D-alanyl-D-alanine carboxypeptidase (penicillin-binding protein 5/6)
LKILVLGVAAVVALIPVVLVAAYNRPLSPLSAEQVIASDMTVGSAPSLAWPAQGQAALGIGSLGVIESSPHPEPLPTASVAKTMTALVTLEARPLRPGESGAGITVTAADVDVYHRYAAEGGSVVNVVAGEQLTEYQALQALMLPSANNIAVLLAQWVSGSEEAFTARMNARAAQIGMRRTHFADASGFDAATVSVPDDLVQLGEVAMKNPVFAGIVDQQQVTLPVDGTRANVNKLLGLDGIVGIKTGNNDQALGVYLTAARYQVAAGTSLLLVAAIQGQPSLQAAFDAARTLLRSVRAVLRQVRLVSRGQTVGQYRAPWGGVAMLEAASDLDAVVWPGRTVAVTLDARSVLPPLASGAIVGSLHVSAAGDPPPVPVVAAAPIRTPTTGWRLSPHAVPPPVSQARPGP